MKKTAIITGITGMDGSYLSDLLLEKNYRVYGIKRRSASNDLGCSSHLENEKNFEVVEADITDLPSLQKVCSLAKADEFYSLAAMSHVGTSFTNPITTAQITGLGTLNCLEAIRNSGIHTKFYNAASSELFGGINGNKKNTEETPFYPRSPYGVSKLFGFWITKNYRESYKMFASSGILHNHEGERRGPNFVTRKITLAVANIKAGKQKKLYLGNLDSYRDWGYAPDFCKGMHLILQHNRPDDFVLATGETHSVREFCEIAFNHVGLDYKNYVEIDSRFYRPAEVDVLIGDHSKAKKILNWEPKTTFKELVKIMVDSDLKLVGANFG